MKKLILSIFTVSLLLGCQYFESDKYYSCVESQPNDGNKFSLIVGGKTVKVGRVVYERCSSEDVTVLFSGHCKDLDTGYFGTLDLITGEFYSTKKETPDSKVKNYTKGICNRVEKI